MLTSEHVSQAQLPSRFKRSADSGGGGTPMVASEPPVKRNRGRPPGSGKKQLDALGGVGGVGFTPHVITVKAGEDISSKIMAFSQQGPQTVCILPGNGAICNVTLCQPAMSGGTVTYEQNQWLDCVTSRVRWSSFGRRSGWNADGSITCTVYALNLLQEL